MKKFTLIMMIAGSLLVTGCKKDEDRVATPVKVQSVVVKDGLNKIKGAIDQSLAEYPKEGNCTVVTTEYGTKIYHSYSIVENKLIKTEEFTIDRLFKTRYIFTVAEDAKVTLLVEVWNVDTNKYENPLSKTFTNADEFVQSMTIAK